MRPHEKLRICFACDRYDHTFGICKECGCYMKFKVRVKKNWCPLGKHEVKDNDSD